MREMTVLSCSSVPINGKNFKPGSRHIFYQNGSNICKIPIVFVRTRVDLRDLSGLVLRVAPKEFREKIVLHREKKSSAFELSQDEQMLFICEGQKLFQYIFSGEKVENQIEEHKRDITQLTMDREKEFLYR